MFAQSAHRREVPLKNTAKSVAVTAGPVALKFASELKCRDRMSSGLHHARDRRIVSVFGNAADRIFHEVDIEAFFNCIERREGYTYFRP